MALDPETLIFDWNLPESGRGVPLSVELLDDTLRDGLQNASVRQPSSGERIELLHAMAALGVNAANLGLPGAGARAFEECLTLCREVETSKLPLEIACAGRTLESDLKAIVELAQRAGRKLEAHAFIGSSPIRAYAEGWDRELIVRRSADAVAFLVREGLPVTFVTEDTTRSEPKLLAELFNVAVSEGAERLCLCDTVGHVTPEGVARLVGFARKCTSLENPNLALDWHGHNDRGLALANALAAAACGVARVHATALGIGERVGNTPLELVALNLELAGAYGGRAERLLDYCARASRILGWQIPPNYPLVGENAFRTATGVHAAAILKAREKASVLADQVYSGVPAGRFGRKQEVCIGAMSGASNVSYWLRERGIEPNAALVSEILERAKASNHILADDEVLAIVREQR